MVASHEVQHAGVSVCPVVAVHRELGALPPVHRPLQGAHPLVMGLGGRPPYPVSFDAGHVPLGTVVSVDAGLVEWAVDAVERALVVAERCENLLHPQHLGISLAALGWPVGLAALACLTGDDTVLGEVQGGVASVAGAVSAATLGPSVPALKVQMNAGDVADCAHIRDPLA